MVKILNVKDGNSRIIGIDAARGGAVILVVLMHACLPVYDQLPASMKLINHAVGGARMPLLFFLSGYLARTALLDKRRALRRGADLLWVYVIWTGIGWLTNGWNFVGLLFAPSSALWYIWGLAFAALTLPIICRMPPVAAIGVSAAVAMASYAHLLRVDPHTTEHLLRQLVFFYVGLYAGRPIVTALSASPTITFSASAAIIVVTHLLNEVTTTIISVPVLALPERAAIMAAVLNICLLAPAASLRPFAWFGRRSLQIYVGHVMLLFPLQVVVTGMPWAVHVAIVTVSATAISLAAHQLARLGGCEFLYQRPRIRFEMLRPAVSILFAPVSGSVRTAAFARLRENAGQRR